MIEPPCCLKYKPGDVIAVRERNWDEIFEMVDGEN
jgi:hypothetical protein